MVSLKLRTNVQCKNDQTQDRTTRKEKENFQQQCVVFSLHGYSLSQIESEISYPLAMATMLLFKLDFLFPTRKWFTMLFTFTEVLIKTTK